MVFAAGVYTSCPLPVTNQQPNLRRFMWVNGLTPLSHEPIVHECPIVCGQSYTIIYLCSCLEPVKLRPTMILCEYQVRYMKVQMYVNDMNP
jgi:hypothetical protein